MRKLVSEQGSVAKICSRLSGLINRWWVKFFILPMFQTVPPGFIIFSIDHKVIPVSGDAEAAGQVLNGMVGYFSNYPYWSFLFAAAYLILLNGLISFVQHQSGDAEEIDSKGLLTLFEALEMIVGAKANRFGEHLKALKNGSKNSVEVFEDITKPDQQIAFIVRGLHGFFDAIDRDDVNFKVCLIAVEDGKPSDFYYYYPAGEPPKARIEDLQLDESTVSACIKKKDIVIISNAQIEVGKDEGRRYVASSSGQDDRSIICYPVIHHYTNSIPYVISVVADKNDYFQIKKKPFYKWIFRHFAVRMALEHSLLELKKETNNHE